MSSLKDLASLIMIPSLYKNDVLTTVKPLADEDLIIHPDSTGAHDGVDADTSDKTSSDFTFSRGSNLSATRINSDGLIEKGRENLLTQSNTFSDSDWFKTNATITSGQSGYDGTSDAWKFEATTTSATLLQQNAPVSANTPTTLSVFAKSGNVDFLKFIIVCSGSNSIVTFDLSDGSALSNLRNISVNAEDVGGGWYRCSATAAPATNITLVRFELRSTAGSGSADAGSYIFIQDSQFELGLAVTDKIESRATAGKAGILEDMPRLDYSGGATFPSLLLEPQRSNVLQQSEYYNTYHTRNNVSVTDNAATSPEGLQNASKLIPNSGTGGNRSLSRSFTGLSGIHTFSVFAKAGEYGYVSLRMRNSPSNFVMFDLSDGSVHNTNSSGDQYVNNSAKVEDFGNGWYRCSASFDPSESSTAGDLFPSLSVGITGDETQNWNGDGTSGIFIYGMQFESGSYPTSYIPTYGASVTRSVDDMDTTFSSSISTDGSATIFFHELGLPDSADVFSAGGDYRYQKDNSNYVSLTSEVTNWRIRVQGGGSGNFKGLAGYAKTSPIKVAVVVTSTTYSIYVNGSAVFENVSMAATADFSSIDGFQTFIQEAIGVRRAIQNAVFPTALTSSEAIALTTL